MSNTKSNIIAIPCYLAVGALATMSLGGDPAFVGSAAKMVWIAVAGLSIATLIHPGKKQV